MTELNRHFLEIHDKFGAPHPAVRPSPDEVEAYRGRLPDGLLDYWTLHGWGPWRDGVFQLCNPADYAGVVELFLRGDPEFRPAETHLYGYTAFGTLFFWNETYQTCRLRTYSLQLSSTRYVRPDLVLTADDAIGGNLYSVDDRAYDLADEDGKRMFAPARKGLGALGPGEVYGFRLALALGGAQTLANLQKVRAREHFAILAQLDTLHLVNFGVMPAKVIRAVGG